MGIIDRISAAANVLFSGRGGGGSTYSLRYLPAPTSRFNWQIEAGEIRSNPIVAVCVDFGARCLQQVQFKVVRRRRSGTEDEIDDHPVLQLIERPNPIHSRVDMLTLLYTDFMVEGTAFQFIADNRMGLAGELYWFDSRYTAPTFPTDGSEYLTGWKYTPAGTGRTRDYDESKIIVFRHGIDPVNDRLGMSPLRSCVREIAMTNLATGYTAGILKNSGASTLVITPENGSSFTADEARDMRISTQQRTSGEQAGTPLVLTVPAKVAGLGANPGELLLTDIDSGAVARICAAFGFSPMAVNLPDTQRTYSNYGESLKSSWKNGIIPVVDHMVDRWNHVLMGRYDRTGRMKIVACYEHIQELAEDRSELAKTASLLFEKGIAMQNEARAMVGLEAVDGGDVFAHELKGPESPEPDGDEQEESGGSGGPQEGDAGEESGDEESEAA